VLKRKQEFIMKKHGFLLVLLAGFTVSFFSGCIIYDDFDGNGRVVSRERHAGEFDTVVLEGVGNIDVYPGVQYKGGDYGVVVTTDSNLQDFIFIDTDGTSLYVSERRHSHFSPTKLVIEVYLPELRSVSLEGVGDIRVHNGPVSNLKMKLSGVGDIDAANCPAQNVNFSLSGTGSIKTWAVNTLTGKLSGVGDIYYRGNPARDIERSGIGEVKKIRN
jgi:hypothetical protein